MGYDKGDSKRRYDRQAGKQLKEEESSASKSSRSNTTSKTKSDSNRYADPVFEQRSRAYSATPKSAPTSTARAFRAKNPEKRAAKSLAWWVYIPILLGDGGMLIILFVGIFWLVFGIANFLSFGAIIYTLVTSMSNLKKARTLSHGVITMGRVSRKEKTGKKINKQWVYRVWFTYQSESGEPLESSLYTHKLDKVTDDDLEVLIYDRRAPTNFLAIDVLPLIVQSHIKNHFKTS